jgi:phage terminase small subunit
MPRKPQPDALKRLHGSRFAGRRKEHVAEGGALEPTDAVCAWPRARAFWEHYRRWAPIGLLKPCDAPLLSRLCVSLAIGEEAALVIAADGPFKHKPRKGAQTPLAILRVQTDVTRQLASELGLSPVARVRAAAPDAPGDRSTRAGTFGDPKRPARGVKPEQDERPGSALETFLALRPARMLQ